MKTFDFHYPSPAELYALEQKARRERAEAMGHLVAAIGRGLKSLFVRAFAVRGPSAETVSKQVVRHA